MKLPKIRKKIVRFPRTETISKPFSMIKAEDVEWLWPRRIPKAKITILDGDPDVGKSFLTLEIAARISRGAPLPPFRKSRRPSNVIVLSAEDGAGDTIRPRLEAARADLERISFISTIPDGKTGKRFPEIPKDVALLESEVFARRAALLIIDPLTSYLPKGVNSWRDQDVRRALAPLAEMAERTGVAILIVRHLNKRYGGNPIYRGGGSIGIIGAARSGLLFALDPTDPKVRVLAGTKSNLGPKPTSLAFKIVKSKNRVRRFVYIGKTNVTAEDLLDHRAIAIASTFIRKNLGSRSMPSKKIKKLAKKEGIAPRTLDRAKKVLKIKSKKSGFGDEGKWKWSQVRRAV